MCKKRLILAAAAAPTLFASFARGDAYNWTPTAAGSFNWTDAADWAGGSNPFPQLTDDSATIQPGPAGPVNINLPIAVSIGNLNFGSSASPQLIDIGNNNSGGGTLNIVAGGGTGTITAGGVDGAIDRISAPLAIASNLTLDASSTNSLTLSGGILVSGGNRIINVNTTKAVTISGPISLSESATNRTLTFSPASGSGDVTITGTIGNGASTASTLVFGVNNTSTSFVYPNYILAPGATGTQSNTTINRVNLVVNSNDPNILGSSTGLLIITGAANIFAARISSTNGPKIINVGRTQLGNIFTEFVGNNSFEFTNLFGQSANREMANLINPGTGTLTLHDVYTSQTLTDNRIFTIDGPGNTIIKGSVFYSNAGPANTSFTGSFDKRGVGLARIEGGSSDYNGGTRVRGGILEFSQIGGINSSSGVTVDVGGAIGLLTGSMDSTFIGKLTAGAKILFGSGANSGNTADPFTSHGAIALANVPGDTGATIDFVNGPLSASFTQGMSVGACVTNAPNGVTFTGTIVPANNTYHLSGGGTLILPNAQLTGAGNRLVMDNGGTVVLGGNNTYDGATTIGGNWINPAQVLAADAQSSVFTTVIPAGSTVTKALRANTTASVATLPNGGANSPVGSSSNAAGNLIFNGGTLRYTGGGSNTDRLFTIQPNGATIDASGSGALAFTNVGAIVSADTTISSGTLDASGRWLAVSDNSTITPGMTVSGTGIAGGTTVASVMPDSSFNNFGGGPNALPFYVFLNTVGTAGTPNDLVFGNQNRTLTLAGTNTGANTIAAVLSNSSSGSLGVTKTGSGKWILSGGNNYGGVTTVQGGTLELGTSAQTPVLGAGAAGADIQGGKLALDYTGPSPVVSINSMVGAGAGSNFTTGQIRSSTAGTTRALGVFDNGSSVQIAQTLFGDANLDFRVNALDFNALATNFGASSAIWMRGDFNYDGKVNSVDFNLLASNFNQSIATPAPALGALVPEPASLGLLLSSAMLCLRRRKSTR